MSKKFPFSVGLFILLSFFYQDSLAQFGKIEIFIEKEVKGDNDEFEIFLENDEKSYSFDQNNKIVLDSIAFGRINFSFIQNGHHIDYHTIDHNSEYSVYKLSDPNGITTLKEHIITKKSEVKEIETKGFAVNVITTERESLQNIQTNELLDRSAGVRIRQSGGIGSNVEYNINGLSGNSIRIFIDGIPINNFGPSYSINSIPPALIERIEIYKGVVPSYLTDDALGGAINIVLKKSAKNNLNVSYSIGTFNSHQANLNGFYRNEKNGFTIKASGFYNYTDNNYEVWGDKVYTTDPSNGKIIKGNRYKRFHDAYQSYGTKFELGFTHTKWADELLIGFLYSDMYKEIQHGATMEIVYGNRSSNQNTQMATLTYRKKNLGIQNLDVQMLATFSYLNRNVIDTINDRYNWDGTILGKWSNGGEQNRATLQKSDEYNFSFRGNVSYAFIPQNVFSINWMYNDFVRKMDDPYLPAAEREFLKDNTLNKNFIGANYENNAFNNKLKTSLFLKYYLQSISTTQTTKSGPGNGVTKYEDIKNNSDEMGYGLAISYEINSKFILLTSLEKAIRFPGNTEVFGNNADNILANANLRPEKSYNANIGLHAGPFHFYNEMNELGFNVNGFFRKTNDMIRQGVPSAINETFSFENLNEVLSFGFDIEAKYMWNRKIFLVANASLFESKFNTQFDAQGNPFFYYGSRLRNAPFFTSNINARYDVNHLIQKNARISFNYNLGYVHEFLRDWEGIGGRNLDYVPTQLVHDFGVTYTFPNRKITLGMDIKNIMDRQVFDNWALQKPGRSLFFKINYRIF